MNVYKMNQNKAPIYEALESFRNKRIVPFDVPGHKRGRGNKELTDFLGERCMSVDVNSMKPLDNLCHPVSIIRNAEQLASDAFGSSNAFFMVGGTTSAIQAMIFSTCKRGDKIIIPRNVNSCVINALIICGAIPEYMYPEINEKFGIPLGITCEQVQYMIDRYPDAKAIYVNNPSYYGICSDIQSIVNLAHQAGMLCLVDETYGAHFYFGDDMPMSAMEAGADMSSISMHKSGTSLTQSSLLLIGPKINAEYIRQVINLTQTTSASYLFMASLDISRRNLALRGKEIFKKLITMSDYARDEINSIGGYIAFGKDLIDKKYVYDFDPTKLSIFTKNIGFTGIEVYDILQKEYDIQLELGDMNNILAYISMENDIEDLERLVSALADIHRRYSKPVNYEIYFNFRNREILMSPQEAFYANRVNVPLKKSEGRISCECVTCHPSEIPLLVPGERISENVLNYIYNAQKKGCFITGSENSELLYIHVIQNKKGEKHEPSNY